MSALSLTDVWLQPIRSQNPPERDRTFASPGRGWFIYRQAETARRHFAAELCSGASVEVKRQLSWKNRIVITLRLLPDGSGRQPAPRQVKPRSNCHQRPGEPLERVVRGEALALTAITKR